MKHNAETQKTPSVKKNFILRSLLTVSSVLFPLITFPYVSRILGPDGIGRVSFATSFVAYFGIIAKMGIPLYGVRICAQVRDDREELSRTVQELLIINLIMSAVAYLGLFACMAAVPKVHADRQLYLIISISLLLDAIGMEWLFGALEQYTYITIRSLFFKLVALCATFILIHHPEDVLLYGTITIIATSASGILNFCYAQKFITLRPAGRYNFKRHRKPVLIFFAMVCATTIYTNLDAVMLGFMQTDADVGFYNAAVKIKNMLVGVVTALGTVLLPRMSYYIEHGNRDAFRRMIRKALPFVMLVAFPCVMYFILFAKDSILLLSGKGFADSVMPMQIIMPTVLLIGLTDVLGIQILVPMKKEKTVLYSVVAGAAVDVVLNALLIPQYKAAGAAVGTLVAEAVVLVMQYTRLRGEVGIIFREYGWLRMGLALLIASAASLWIRWIDVASFWKLAMSAICFFGAYGGFLVWRREEILTDILKQIRAKLFNLL